jgi:hypothetical protein
MAQLFDDVVDRLCGGLDRKGARRTAEASIPSALALIQIEIDKRNILEFDVFPNIDFSPVQQGVNADMRALWESRFKLIPQLRWLIAKIPIAVLIPWRKVALFCARALFVRANAQDNARITFVFDQILEALRLQRRAAGHAPHGRIHSRGQGFFVLPDH